jgi:hypothetical protein
MNIQVALDRLRSVVTERGAGGAYVLTVSDDGSPHAVHQDVRSARPRVSLLFPARHDGDHSLIVDGKGTVESGARGPRLRLAPTHAVLHRAGPPADPTSSCAADCVPVLITQPVPRPGS